MTSRFHPVLRVTVLASGLCLLGVAGSAPAAPGSGLGSSTGSSMEPGADPGTGPGGGTGTSTVERTLYLMGTRAELRVEATDRAAALAASEAAVRALEESEARLSTWRQPAPGRPSPLPGGGAGEEVGEMGEVGEVAEAGELARLNRAPVGEPVALSPRLAEELRRAEACRRATGGAFDPGVGALVAAWGLRDGGRQPTPPELRRALEAGGDDLEIRATPAGAVAVRRNAGLVLDEGAWGKGAGLDRATAALAALPGVLAADLDLGGQVAVVRRGDAARPAVIDLADPRARQRIVARLEIPSGSVATSGNSERGVVVDGRRIGHLLDPRTGRPAPDFGSLSVWAPTALEADCLATGLYVLGPDAALAWAEAHPGVEVVVARVTPDGVEIEATRGLKGILSSPAEDAGIKARAGAGRSVASEVPSPCSPEDRGRRVGARRHEPRADFHPRS